jgi:hypothetical protein
MGILSTIGRTLRQIAIVVGYLLLIGVIVLTILFAHRSEREHRQSQPVTSFNITVEGTQRYTLIDEISMQAWIREHGIAPEECSLAELNLSQLESVVLEHSAVASANAYTSYDGAVVMNIAQREPLMRLRTTSHNQYVDKNGYVFSATNGYAAYVPVVTGDYRPLFDGEFSGSIAEYVGDSIASTHRLIDAIEHEKYDIYRTKKRAQDDLKRVRDSVIRAPFWLSDATVQSMENALKQYQEEYQIRYTQEEQKRDKMIEKHEAEQQKLYEKIARLEKRYHDFNSLITFVEWLSEDEFWAGEITQIVIGEGGDGHIQLQVVPRSGDFVIDIGAVESIEHKFESLEKFYSTVLSNVGWQTYNHVSVRYDGQVVCRKSPNVASEAE